MSQGAEIDVSKAVPTSGSEASSATGYWKAKVRSATSIEEISRLEINFKKLKELERTLSENEGQTTELVESSASEEGPQVGKWPCW